MKCSSPSCTASLILILLLITSWQWHHHWGWCSAVGVPEIIFFPNQLCDAVSGGTRWDISSIVSYWAVRSLLTKFFWNSRHDILEPTVLLAWTCINVCMYMYVSIHINTITVQGYRPNVLRVSLSTCVSFRAKPLTALVLSLEHSQQMSRISSRPKNPLVPPLDTVWLQF